MENLSYIEILKLGLSGVVFLFAMFSYRLLSNEQSKEAPSPDMLKSIKVYMGITALFGVLTLVSETVGRYVDPQPSLDFFVIIEPPAGVNAETFELKSGIYEYFPDPSNSDNSVANSGPVVLAEGQNIGWWTAQFPYHSSTRPVKLILNDKAGKSWVVRYFYPNQNNRPLIEEAQPLQDHASVNLPISFLIREAVATEKTKFDNYAQKIYSKGDKTYYKWRVFVDASDETLNKIAEVEYLLHPTYPEPLQVRTNPRDKFAVEATGWGQFSMRISIKYKNRPTETTSYLVNFKKKWPEQDN